MREKSQTSIFWETCSNPGKWADILYFSESLLMGSQLMLSWEQTDKPPNHYLKKPLNVITL
jgi:hypothetical protein